MLDLRVRRSASVTARWSLVNRLLKTILIGAGLLYPALGGYAGQEPASPTQGQQQNQADGTSKGIKPRASAENYASHAEAKGIAMGATLLTPDEVRRDFTVDLNSCCIVLEVAVFPENGQNLEIARKDFSLRVTGTSTAVKPSSPDLLAIGFRLSPRGGSMTPHGSVGVTYGLGGYDPRTGQTISHSVDTSADVAVGTPPLSSQPTELDRELMELELSKKSLPEGKISTPVAGYLYFPRTKKKKRAARLLEYTMAGEKITLSLP